VDVEVRGGFFFKLSTNRLINLPAGLLKIGLFSSDFIFYFD